MVLKDRDYHRRRHVNAALALGFVPPNAEADQRRTTDSDSPLVASRRLIQRLVRRLHAHRSGLDVKGMAAGGVEDADRKAALKLERDALRGIDCASADAATDAGVNPQRPMGVDALTAEISLIQYRAVLGEQFPRPLNLQSSNVFVASLGFE